jgi:hypothetical protein
LIEDQGLARGLDGIEQILGTGSEVAMEQDRSWLIEDTEVHPTGMQADTTVVSVAFDVQSYQVFS